MPESCLLPEVLTLRLDLTIFHNEAAPFATGLTVSTAVAAVDMQMHAAKKSNFIHLELWR